jgi:hypothetical protein
MNSFRFINTTVLVTIPYNMKDEDVIALFKNNISGFDGTKRYVAIHDPTGDCVIYENGVIDRVSDSG